MRIALVHLNIGGGGTVLGFSLAKQLNNQADVLAIVSKQSDNIDEWRASGVEVIEIDTGRSPSTLLANSLNFFAHMRTIQSIREFNPDVFYFPMIHPWTPFLYIPFPSVPKVVTIHEPTLRKGEWKNPIRCIKHGLIKPLMLRQASRVVVCVNSFVDRIARRGIPEDRIDVIPHGKLSYYNDGSDEGYSSNRPVILFFGRITPYKDLETLLLSFKQVREEKPEAKLIIAGKGDISDYETYFNTIPDDHIEIHNRWIEDDEVAKFFDKADILAAPYNDAAQSGVIAIAYGFGLPVVSTTVGGIPDQVEDGKTGLLVNPDSPGAFADACVRILEHEELSNSLTKGAKRKADRELDWQTISEKVITSCSKAITDKNAF